MKLIYAFNLDGLYDHTRDQLVDDNVATPSGYTDSPPMTKNAGGTYTGFYKPKWNGNNWVESATQDYIDGLKLTPQPTDVEILQQQQADLIYQLMSNEVI